MSEWYYTSAGQQLGPVSSAQLKLAAQSGQLTPTDLVWKDGMPDWVPAAKLKGIFDGAPSAAAPITSASVVAAPAPAATYDAAPASSEVYPPHAAAPQQQFGGQPGSQIGYYNPNAGLNARVANNMKGFPPPTGPQDQWPMGDIQLIQFVTAESHRKHIRALASLFQLFYVLGIIASIVVVLGAVFGMAMGGRGAGVAGTVLAIVAAFVVALTILYYFAARETRRCRIWPAIVFAALYALAILLNFASFFLAASSGPRGGPGGDPMGGLGMIGPILSSIIPAIFLWMCMKAISSIPKFLAAPLWAQEALVAAKL